MTSRLRLPALALLAALPLAAGPNAYVPSYTDGTVTVIDTATQAVLTTLTGVSSPLGVAVNSAGTRVYVAEYGSPYRILIYNTATNAPAGSIVVGAPMRSLAINPAGTRLVASITSGGQGGAVIYDLTTNSLQSSLLLGGAGAGGVAISPDGQWAYVADGPGNLLSFINLATLTPAGAINTLNWPLGVVFSPDGSRAYVANYSGGSVTVIDTATRTALTDYPTGSGPFMLAVSRDGATLYAGCAGANRVNVIDAASGLITGNIFLPGGGTPYGLAFHPAGALLYVVDNSNSRLLGFNTASANALELNVPTGAQSYAFGQFVQPFGPRVANAALPGGNLGYAYSQALTAYGGTPPYAWSLLSGALPPGLSLNGATGALTGTPAAGGSYGFTAAVTDAAGRTDNRAFSLPVSTPAALAVATATLPDAEAGIAYGQSLAATGGVAPYAWDATAGRPAWLSVGAFSGGNNLSGTPAAGDAGPVNLTIRVTDSGGFTATRALGFTVRPHVVINTGSLPNGVVGRTYNQTLQAAFGVPPYSWSLTGSLPPGLFFNPVTGAITGEPAYAGASTVYPQVTDALGATDTLAIPLTVTGGLAILTSSLPQGVQGAYYPTYGLLATGGTAPYTYAITAGSLPPGITLGASGFFNGLPSVAGSTTFTVQATDAAAQSVSKAFTLVVSAAPGGANWSPRGLYGGKLRQIVPSPDYDADGTLFAAGTAGELYKSVDRGLTWQSRVIDPARAYSAIKLALPPTFSQNGSSQDAQTVFAFSRDIGIWKSVDQGNTFTASNAGLCFGAGTCNASHVTDPSLVFSPNYAVDHTLFAAFNWLSGPSWQLSIYRSVNGGLDWTPLANFTDPLAGGRVNLRISPAFAADQTLLLSVESKAVHRSVNGGANWSQVFSAAGTSFEAALEFSPDFATDRTVLLAADGTFYRSGDGGATFSALATPVNKFAVVKRSGASPLVVAGYVDALHYNLFSSDNYGATFSGLYAKGFRKPTASLNPETALAARRAPGGSIQVWSATEYGVDYSADGGLSFEARDKGIGAVEVSSLSGRDSTVAAGGNSAWYLSTDLGASWTRRPVPFPLSDQLSVWLSPDYALDGVIFLGNFNYLARSSDFGQSFTAVMSGMQPWELAFAPGFSGDSGTVFAATSQGLRKSVDGGRTFTTVTAGSGVCAFSAGVSTWGLAVSPAFAVDQTVFASTFEGQTVCRSDDGGATWAIATSTFGKRIALSPNFNGLTRAGGVLVTGLQARRSNNGGLTWSDVSGFPFTGEGIPVFSPNYLTDATVLIAGSAGNSPGIWRSADGGATFARIGGGDALLSRRLGGLYLAPSFNGGSFFNSVAVAGALGSGIFRSSDGGRTFTAGDAYKTVSNLINGVGRASDGTLYTAEGLLGVSRSLDDGATFTPFSNGLPKGADVRAIVAPQNYPGNPIAALAGWGLWRYSGGAWAQLTGGPLTTRLNYVSFLDDGVYVYANCNNGVSIRSPDGGLTWNSQDPTFTDLVFSDYNPITAPAFTAPASDRLRGPRRAEFFTANTASLWSVSQTAGPSYSTTNGITWIPATGTGDYILPGGLSYSTVNVMGIDPVTGGRVVLAGTTTGLWRSNDGGVTWRNVSGAGSGLELSSRNFSASLSTATAYGTTDVLVGATGATDGGVYLSGDAGLHWTQINQGFDPANLSVSSLVKTSCAGCPVQYYSGTYGSGVYTRTVAVNAPPAFPAVNYACAGSTSCTCGSGAFSGPEQGGLAFKLCGTGFQNGAVVEFDGFAAGGCAQSGGTVITCTTTPPHVPGNARVVVRNPDTRAGALPGNFAYLAGAPRAGNSLRLAREGANAALTWNCPGCSAALPARVYRAQNGAFTLYPEQYNGGTGGSWSDPGAIGNPRSYFWSVE